MKTSPHPTQRTFVGLPFYIFITILLTSIGIISVTSVWKNGQTGSAITISALYFFHILMYWGNLRWHQNTRWLWSYYAVQSILIVSLSLLPYGQQFIVSGIISIIGEGLGLWGNTRRALFVGIFYSTMLITIMVISSPPDEFWGVLGQIVVNGGFIILVLVMFNQQLIERQKAEELAETLESANAKLAAYAARNEALTLKAERERLARELHDTLAQGVAGVILQLEATKAHQQQQNFSQAGAVLDQALGRARNTLSESRAAIEDLRNQDIDFDQAVQSMVAQFEAQYPLAFSLSINIDQRSLSSQIQHHARRVLYESITNACRHAQAEHVSISVNAHGEQLILKITDDGDGFDTSQPPQAGHFGLQGLAERASLTNSQFHINSEIGKGTTVVFTMPIKEKLV